MAEHKDIDGMTPAEQRVAIAKDALAWLEAGALKADRGSYVWISGGVRLKGDPSVQLRDIVIGKCDVCALGALFIAKAVRFNEVTVFDAFSYSTFASCIGSSPVYSKLLHHFDRVQLHEIEDAFESSKEPPKTVMRRILKNIIRNGGEYKP